jgi:hypothetical protein
MPHKPHAFRGPELCTANYSLQVYLVVADRDFNPQYFSLDLLSLQVIPIGELIETFHLAG